MVNPAVLLGYIYIYISIEIYISLTMRTLAVICGIYDANMTTAVPFSAYQPGDSANTLTGWGVGG